MFVSLFIILLIHSYIYILSCLHFLTNFLLTLTGGKWFGVDVMSEDIADNFIACVWEPAIVKINALTAASEAACLILSVDETIKSPRSSHDAPQGPMPGRGRGRPM